MKKFFAFFAAHILVHITGAAQGQGCETRLVKSELSSDGILCFNTNNFINKHKIGNDYMYINKAAGRLIYSDVKEFVDMYLPDSALPFEYTSVYLVCYADRACHTTSFGGFNYDWNGDYKDGIFPLFINNNTRDGGIYSPSPVVPVPGTPALLCPGFIARTFFRNPRKNSAA